MGTQIQAGGNLSLSAGKDINAQAATVSAAGLLSVQAGNNVNITAGRASQSLTEGKRFTSQGWRARVPSV